MGKWKFARPCRSETPKILKPKLGWMITSSTPYNHANFRGNRSKGVCCPNRWNITHLWLCVYLSFPPLSYFSCRCLQQRWVDGCHDLYLKRRVFTQGCAFWGSWWPKHCSGIKTPKNKTPKTPQIYVVRQFQAKSKKNWNCYIFNRIDQINTDRHIDRIVRSQPRYTPQPIG